MPLGSSGLDNSPTTSRRLIIPKPLSRRFHIYFAHLCIAVFREAALPRLQGRSREGTGRPRPPRPRAGGAPSGRRDDTKPDRPASQSASPERARQPALTNEGRAARPGGIPSTARGSRGAPAALGPRPPVRAAGTPRGRAGPGQRGCPVGLGHAVTGTTARPSQRGGGARSRAADKGRAVVPVPAKPPSAPGVRARPPLHTCGNPRVGAPAASHPPAPLGAALCPGSLLGPGSLYFGIIQLLQVFC